MIERFPENVIALNNLAYLFVKTKQERELALELAARAVVSARAQQASGGMLIALLDTQGLAALAANELATAEGAFREGLSFDPEDVRMLIGLAELLDRRGDLTERQTILERLERAVEETELPDELKARLAALGG